MVFFTAVFYVLIGALGIALAIGLVFGVVSFIYAIPYCLWVGTQNTIGLQKDKKNEKFSATLKHATQLYGAWIKHKKPTF